MTSGKSCSIKQTEVVHYIIDNNNIMHLEIEMSVKK